MLRSWLAVATVSLAFSAVPATGEDYFPDFSEFDGTNPYVVPPDPAFGIDGFGTIEFWVQPEFTQTPVDDPVLVANYAESGENYTIAMTRDLDALVLLLGGQAPAFIEADFNDGRAHHVAINFFSDGVIAYVDGRERAEFDQIVPNDPSTGFYIGSAANGEARFVGGLGQLRIWDYPVNPDYLIEFATKPTLSEELGDHPDIASLRVFSEFANDEIHIVESVESLAEAASAQD